MSESENDNFLLYDSQRDTEAILSNEPFDISYTVISPSKISLFPFVLLGQIKTYFNSPKTSEGVGILIGDDIVLASAHNIYPGSNNKIVKIEFIPLINGAIKLLKPIKCRKYIMLQKFQELKNKQNNTNSFDNEILRYDFVVCFLEGKLGREIIDMFHLENDKHFQFWRFDKRIFRFFLKKNEIIDKILKKFEKGDINEKISMISYIKVKSEFIKDQNFRYRKSIIRLIQNSNNNMSFSPSKQGSFIIPSEITQNSIRLSSCSMNSNNIVLNNYENNCTDIFYPLCNTYNAKNGSNNRFIENQVFFDDSQNIVLCEGKGALFNNNICYQKKIDLSFSRNLSITRETKSTRDTLSPTVNTSIRLSTEPLPTPTKNPYELDYLISTYVGQSGSPIFLRKRDNDYYLIGLHSRSSKLMPIESKANNYITKSGYSNYNIGLTLNKDVHNDIITMINMDKCNKYHNIKHDSSNHLIIDFKYNGILVFSGIFPLHFLIENFFVILAKNYFSIDKEYIKLEIDNKYFYHDYCEGRKIILENLVDYKNFYRISFNVVIEIKEFAQVTSQKIIKKINEIKEVCNKEKDGIINIIVTTIQNELKAINDKNMLLFGILYSKIQKKVAKAFIKYIK